jgi:hypothetical protein
MAYEIMYEGDGFIRKGPKPLEGGPKEESSVSVEKQQAVPAKGPARRRGGITLFRFTRLIFR